MTSVFRPGSTRGRGGASTGGQVGARPRTNAYAKKSATKSMAQEPRKTAMPTCAVRSAPRGSRRYRTRSRTSPGAGSRRRSPRCATTRATSALPGGHRRLGAARQDLRLSCEVSAGEPPHLGIRELVRPAHDLGDPVEVVERRRRAGGRPLERRHLPRVRAGRSGAPAEDAPEEVHDEEELASEEREGEVARPLVEAAEPLDERVLERIEEAPLLARVAGEELATEDEREAEEGEPEVHLAEPLVEPPPEHLREPEVDRRRTRPAPRPPPS